MVLFSYQFWLCSSNSTLMCLLLMIIPVIPILGLLNRQFELRFPTHSVHFCLLFCSRICYSDYSDFNVLLFCCIMGKSVGYKRRVRSPLTLVAIRDSHRSHYRKSKYLTETNHYTTVSSQGSLNTDILDLQK